MRRRVKRHKHIRVLFFLCAVLFIFFASIMLGGFFAHRIIKPINENDNLLSNMKSSGIAGDDIILPDDDLAFLVVFADEFISAEHLKSTEKLANITSPNYYPALMADIANIKKAAVTIDKINFLKIERKYVKIEVTYTTNSGKYSEKIYIKQIDDSWKIDGVER
ncbi:MAG: hypothetical protein QME45_06410 [Clostridiales bacterium]|nr:hypothetical protein [Clostridiales bacterium]HBM80783.1 hypothetical protein [Clostridiaceae bacterium]